MKHCYCERDCDHEPDLQERDRRTIEDAIRLLENIAPFVPRHIECDLRGMRWRLEDIEGFAFAGPALNQIILHERMSDKNRDPEYLASKVAVWPLPEPPPPPAPLPRAWEWFKRYRADTEPRDGRAKMR